MRTTPVILSCYKCGEIVFKGFEDDVYMDVYGDFVDGGSECKECHTKFCVDCGEDGLCLDCYEKLEEEDEE